MEFVEGLTVDYAYAIRAGLNIYAPPSLHFAPNHYPPLHYVVSLPALVLSGGELWGPRLVSILSSLGAGALVVFMLRRAEASWTACLAAVAVAFAYYPDTHYWYDLARVDALLVFLHLAGLWLLAGRDLRPSRREIVLGGLFLAAAVFTKQTAMVLGAASLAWFLWEGDLSRLKTLLMTLAGSGVAGALLLLALYGREALIIYWMPARQFIDIGEGTRAFLGFAWTMAPLLAVALFGLRGSKDAPRNRALRFFLLQFGFAIGIGWLTMCKQGGLSNSSMPAIFLLAAAVGLGLARWIGQSAGFRPVLVTGLLAVFLLGAFQRPYLEWIPSPVDRREAREILDDMRAVDGPFFAYNSFISTVLRGETYPYWELLYDWAGGHTRERHFRPDPALYPADFMNAIRERRFAAIYTNGGDYQGDPAFLLILENYRRVRVWKATLPVNAPATRWKSGVPREKWVPR